MNQDEMKAIITEKLDEIKSYLRIDGDYDDAVLTQCAMTALQYIINAVGLFDPTDSEMLMQLYAITQNFYEDRELMQSDIQQRKRMNYMNASMILQLQLKHGGD